MSSRVGCVSRPGCSARTWCSQPAVGLECRGDERVVHLANGHQIAARAVIVATGIAWSRLGVPRLEALVGSGVFYGAAGSETQAMQGRDVFVVGAGNSAGQVAALHLARHAVQVTLLVRGDTLTRTMSDYLIREIGATSNITVRLRTEVTDGHGADHLDGLTLHDRLHDRTEQVPAAALFVLIGGEPHTTDARRDSARARLHLDRARRRAGWRASVAVAARPLTGPPPPGAPSARGTRRRCRGTGGPHHRPPRQSSWPAVRRNSGRARRRSSVPP